MNGEIRPHFVTVMKWPYQRCKPKHSLGALVWRSRHDEQGLSKKSQLPENAQVVEGGVEGAVEIEIGDLRDESGAAAGRHCWQKLIRFN